MAPVASAHSVVGSDSKYVMSTANGLTGDGCMHN